MITRKIEVEKKETRFTDDRPTPHNGHGGKRAPPRQHKTTQRAIHNVTKVRPWTSLAPRVNTPPSDSLQQPQNVTNRKIVLSSNAHRQKRARPNTTASVLRHRKSQPVVSATVASSSSEQLKSPSAPAFRSQDDGDVPSTDRTARLYRMSGVAYEGAAASPPSERRLLSSGRRTGTTSKAQYFDLSSSRHADRKLGSLSADNSHPRHSPMVTPSASSASGARSSRVAINPWSVTEVPDEDESIAASRIRPAPNSARSKPESEKMPLPGPQPRTGLGVTVHYSKPLKRQKSFPPPSTNSRWLGNTRNARRPLSPMKEEGPGSGELLQMLTDRGPGCLLTEAHVVSNGDDAAAAAEESSSGSSSEEEPELAVHERHRNRRISNKPQTLRQWSEGPAVNSDDYDTDLEEDFPTEPETVADATGGIFYEEQCHKKGIVPVQYLLRNMGEGNLRMRHHYLGGQGTRPLAHALKRNTVCEEIDLSDNYIEGTGAAALADTLKDNMFIVNLNVSNNFIRSEGAEKMAEMLEANTTLKTLSLQGNQLSDEDAKKIAESLKNNMSLSCLDLSHNKFGEVGGLYLAQGIAMNIGLADLDLSWNSIREKGGVAIAKAVAKNAALEILDLSWNGLSHVGTVALANALKSNKTLKVLDISNNRMNPDGAKVLGKALSKNMGLETLLLGLNPIGAEGVEAILKGAAAHPRLKLLGIENTMDLTLIPHLSTFVKELQESRDIMIMATTGPPQQSRINATVLAVFDRFLTENADRMEDLFNQMDKDGSGDVTLEELKYGLKDFGLRLTSKQLDTLLDELDADKSGTIEYSELMQGSALIKREKQKMDRAQAEAMMYKDNATGNTATSPK